MNIALSEAIGAVKSHAPDLFGVRFEKMCAGQPQSISFDTLGDLLLRTASPDERFGVHGQQVFGRSKSSRSMATSARRFGKGKCAGLTACRSP